MYPYFKQAFKIRIIVLLKCHFKNYYFIDLQFTECNKDKKMTA